MPQTIDALPDDPSTLKAMLLAERARAERLEQIIKELQRHRFGRVGQEVVRRYLEPLLEPVFHADSYGYRPRRSATARQRCWRYDWVVDIDIKGFFDSIDHELLLRAAITRGQNLSFLTHFSRMEVQSDQEREVVFDRADCGCVEAGH
jgi:RNA-directed DNA polymerase